MLDQVDYVYEDMLKERGIEVYDGYNLNPRETIKEYNRRHRIDNRKDFTVYNKKRER